MERKVTIRDIAKDCGVSITTVSFALNNIKGRVNEETKQRVLRSAKKLGYIPNVFAKSLKSKLSNTIALIYEESHLSDRNASTLQFVSSSIKYLNQLGKDTLIRLYNSKAEEKNYQEEYLSLYLSNKVDGFLFFCDILSDSFLRILQENHVPFVVISQGAKYNGVDAVGIDNFQAALMGLSHLKKQGYQTIYYFFSKGANKSARQMAFEYFLEQNSIHGTVLAYPEKDITKDGIWNFISPSIQTKEGKTAFFCWNDAAAILLLDIFYAHDIRVPADIGVLGFDNIPASEICNPPLTTIEQPFATLATKSIDILQQRIISGQSSLKTVLLDTRLVVRKSI